MIDAEKGLWQRSGSSIKDWVNASLQEGRQQRRRIVYSIQINKGLCSGSLIAFLQMAEHTMYPFSHHESVGPRGYLFALDCCTN